MFPEIKIFTRFKSAFLIANPWSVMGILLQNCDRACAMGRSIGIGHRD